MKYIILHLSRTGASVMLPTERIRMTEQTRDGAAVSMGRFDTYEKIHVAETVEEIHRMIHKAKDI